MQPRFAPRRDASRGLGHEEPSRRSSVQAGDEHAEDLTPLFHALHSATFAGVTGFRASSERDERGRWMPVFLFDS